MKKYINKILAIVALSVVSLSCDTSGDNKEEYVEVTTDRTGVEVIASSIDEVGPQFMIGQNAVLPDVFSWFNQEVNLNFQLRTERDVSEIAQMNFYVSAQEENGYNYDSFDGFKTLLRTVENVDIPSSKNIEITFDALELGALFEDKFQNTTKGDKSRTADYPLLEGDFFTVTWVIKFADGTMFDSSKKVSPYNSHSIATSQIQIAPPIWEGTFPFELIDITASAMQYDSTFRVGKTGTLSITETGPGEFTVADGGAGFYWKYANNYPDAAMVYDFASGLTDITLRTTGTKSYASWSISVVDAKTVDITWYYNYAGYGTRFGATARVTRSDAYDWPTNLKGDID